MLFCELEGVPTPFHQLVTKLAGETSYSMLNRACDRKKLETFIKEYLTSNPISPSEKKAKKLIDWYDRKPGRALSNHDMAPMDQKEVLLTRIQHYTMCVKKDYLTDVTLRITKCHDVRFYFCGSIKNVRKVCSNVAWALL